MNGSEKNTVDELEEEEIINFVGNGANYYLDKWMNAENPGQKSGWNWAAFFLGMYWLGYRKMYSVVACILCVNVLVDIAELLANIKLSIGATIAIMGIMDISGNAFYYNTMKAKIKKIKNSGESDEEKADLIKKAGGTSWLGVIIVWLAISIIRVGIGFIVLMVEGKM